jgi:hypothetical protein
VRPVSSGRSAGLYALRRCRTQGVFLVSLVFAQQVVTLVLPFEFTSAAQATDRNFVHNHLFDSSGNSQRDTRTVNVINSCRPEIPTMQPCQYRRLCWGRNQFDIAIQLESMLPLIFHQLDDLGFVIIGVKCGSDVSYTSYCNGVLHLLTINHILNFFMLLWETSAAIIDKCKIAIVLHTTQLRIRMASANIHTHVQVYVFYAKTLLSHIMKIWVSRMLLTGGNSNGMYCRLVSMIKIHQY